MGSVVCLPGKLLTANERFSLEDFKYLNFIQHLKTFRFFRQCYIYIYDNEITHFLIVSIYNISCMGSINCHFVVTFIRSSHNYIYNFTLDKKLNHILFLTTCYCWRGSDYNNPSLIVAKLSYVKLTLVIYQRTKGPESRQLRLED